MALINNYYVFVADESVTHDVETTSHAVEKGEPITDHVKRNPYVISISGKIVDHDNKKASDILSALLKLQSEGSLINYLGRNYGGNFQIQSFNTSHPNTVWGGCEFDMTLKEVKIAKQAVVKKDGSKGTTSTQQVSKGENNKVYHIVKKGDCCWNLVTKQYKTLVFYDDGEPIPNQTPTQKCNEIMALNPHAFSRKGDFRTLQIGAKIFVGFRK